MNLAGLDLNLLVALDALLSEQHVSRAAHRLGLSQSATSRTLGRLRELLGDPLLVRASQGMVPTSRAKALQMPVRKILSDIRATLQLRVAFAPQLAADTIRLSMPDMGQALLLPRLTERLAVEAPGVDIDIHPRFMGLEQRVLDTGEIDLLLSSEYDVEPGFHSTYLFTLRHASFVRPGHPALGKALSICEYAQLGHIVVGLQGVTASDIDALLAAHGLERRVALRLPSYLAVPAIIARSDLIATLPSVMSRISPQELCAIEHPVTVPDTKISMIWHERCHHEPLHRWFRQFVADTCREVMSEDE